MTVRYKLKNLKLKLRDFGHSITGNDKVIAEFYSIVDSLSWEHDVLAPCERKAKLQRAIELMTVDYDTPIPARSKTDGVVIGGDYNPYLASVGMNRERVALGRKFMSELGVNAR